jgi:hypothetical protein
MTAFYHHHPRRGDRVGTFFVPYGWRTAGRKVVGLLVDHRTQEFCCLGRWVEQSDDTFWMLAFEGVRAGTYDLYVLEVPGGALAVAEQVKVGGWAMTVTYPQANNQLLTTFPAYGTAATGAPSGTMHPTSGADVGGTVKQTATNWLLQFTGLQPTGGAGPTSYTLQGLQCGSDTHDPISPLYVQS